MATKIENSGDFYQWQITKRSMGERIKHLYNNPLMADVNFLVAEKGEKRESKITVPCHKLVLGLSSPVFFAMFYGELAETGDFIDLPDCDSEGFLEFLRYIYCDEAKLTGNCVMQVLYLAKKYIIPSLTELCRRFLEKHITPQNVLDVLPQVTEIDETHLTSVCWNVVDFHTEEVFISASPSLLDDAHLLSSLLTRDSLTIKEVKIFQAIDGWAECICKQKGLEGSGKNKREVMGETILTLLRFPVMTEAEFASHVPDTEILTETEVVKMFMYFNLGRQPGEFSCIPRGAISTNIKRCKRFSEISGTGCFLHYDRRTAKIVNFKVMNTPVVIRGVRLFGYQKEKYSVILKVNGERVVENQFQSDEQKRDGYYGYDVVFEKPLHLLPKVECVIQAFIHGPKSHYGVSAREEVTCGKAIFRFHGNNGSAQEQGQFAEVLFTYF